MKEIISKTKVQVHQPHYQGTYWPMLFSLKQKNTLPKFNSSPLKSYRNWQVLNPHPVAHLLVIW